MYRRRRVVVFGGLGVLLALLVYLPMTLLAPLPVAVATVTAPEDAPPEVPPLAYPSYGASAIGAVGYPGVLGQSGSADALPMASITKVVTALVVLDAYPLATGEPGPSVTMTAADAALYDTYLAQNGSVTSVRAGLTLTERELLELMLVKSANNYTMSTVLWAFGSNDAFVEAARAWLAENGLDGIVVNEPTGLDYGNVAPADQLVELGRLALEHPVVAEIVATPAVGIADLGVLPNTNALLGTSGVDGIKTGTLDDFGANLLFSADYAVGESTVTLIGVVLGGPDHDVIDRDILALLGSAQANFAEVEVAAEGEAFASFDPIWGDPVTAVASERVALLTWGGSAVETRVETEDIRTGARGEDVGDISFTTGTRTVTIELELAADLADPGPWWRLTNPVALF